MIHPSPSGAFTLARRDDLATSKEAAEAISARTTEIQAHVLAWARSVHEFIDRDLEFAFEGVYGPSTVRTRRVELVRKGLIEATGAVKVMGSGRRATVWRATPCS